MWDKYWFSQQMEPWRWAPNHTSSFKAVTTVYAVLWHNSAISIGTQFVQLQACKPVNKPLITCVCKWSLRNSHCFGMGSNVAVELAGSWCVSYDASDGDRLVYQALCPLGPSVHQSRNHYEAKPYRCRRSFQDASVSDTTAKPLLAHEGFPLAPQTL